MRSIRRSLVTAALLGSFALALAGCATTVTGNGALPTPTLTQVPYASPSATAGPQVQLTVHLANCEHCYVIAYHAKRGTALSSDTGIVAAVVQNGVAHLTLFKSDTRGLALAVKNIPDAYGAKVGVPYVVMGFGGRPDGSTVSAAAAVGEKTGSWCWAGTDAAAFDINVSSARYTVSGSPNHIISFWASPSLVVPVKATNITQLYKGGIGLASAPYCD